jgi:glycosyltransferase involved in cell wall biosynthesis
MKVLVVIPAFNEESNLPEVIEDLKTASHEKVVVNDGSLDNTMAVARSLGLRVISHPFNLGIGCAVQTGLRYALGEGYDAAVQFDGDGQHRADQIERILEPVAKGEADMVIGSRVLATGYSFPHLRRLGIRVFSFLIKLLTGRRITDPTSGFRCYGARALSLFADYYPDDYPEVESTIMAVNGGLRVAEVPAQMRQRASGRSSITPLRSIYYMVKVSLAIVINGLRPRSPRRI